MTDQTTEPDEALVEAVARAIAVAQCEPGSRDLGHEKCDDGGPCEWSTADRERDAALTARTFGWGTEARAAIAAVRAWDAERVCGARSPSDVTCGLAPHDERVTHTALGGHAVITWTNAEVPR